VPVALAWSGLALGRFRGWFCGQDMVPQWCGGPRLLTRSIPSSAAALKQETSLTVHSTVQYSTVDRWAIIDLSPTKCA
jgi:hypothetical protein